MPPAEFDLVSAAYKRNPSPTLARLRDAGPVVRVKLPMIGPVWMVTGHAAVDELLRDHHAFVRDSTRAGRRYITTFMRWAPRRIRSLAESMIGKDEPDHRRLRSLVEQAFLRRSIEGMRPRIAELAAAHLDDAARISGRDGQVDLIPHFARPFPLAVICELLGLPTEDRPKFIRWGSALSRAGSATGIFKALPGIWKLHGYLRDQCRQCRKQSRDGLLGALAQVEHEEGRLSEDEFVAMAFLLLLAGHETTVHLISTAVLALLDDADQRSQLLGNWDLAGPAVEEVLRYMSPIEITKPRFVSRDLEWQGTHLKRGDYVIGMIAAANHDPARFDEPERFDITRDPNPHLSFGAGIHICLGIKLARAEAQIALEQLWTRFPELNLAVPPAEVQWSTRIGIRALSSLPVRLNG